MLSRTTAKNAWSCTLISPTRLYVFVLRSRDKRACCNILHIRLQGTRFGVRVQCVYTDNTRKFTKLFQNTLYYNVQVVKFNRESKIHLLTFHKLYPVNVRLRGTRFCVRVQCVYTDNTRRFTKPFQNTLYYNAQDRKIQP